ncbi:M1 family metallopeptidase [Pseudozobellia thermophila]|uniref:Aminopeptidase N n=1 Tax=Pseudozobellia thermophila TaxID=192903 RepID=A0A1M6N6P4_9FLAO|nr:M1 family metallopeptidase [Pseudozobellia thermophila]SHJ91380.1 aminopeptidase N [Pseudozobellia thermophila]
MRTVFAIILLGFFGVSYGQHQDKVDFLHAEVTVEPLPDTGEVKGSVTYTFKVLKDVDSVFLDAHDMVFEKLRIGKRRASFSQTRDRIVLFDRFKGGKTYRLSMDYTARPKQTLYFLGWQDDVPDNEQIWTQGQGKYTSHWLPSFDAMEEKVEFDLNIIARRPYEVVANGAFRYRKALSESRSLWSFDMKDPMSSYLLAFVIGRYDRQELRSRSGVPIINYYYPHDSLKVEPTYRHTQRIFDFLEEEIGVAYPWQNYKQVPVRDFLYAGMENTGTTIFSDTYVIDSTAFVDKNYVNVNAHELAHQWFGDLVTEKDGKHHWLHEGFATYYAYLAERHLFGDDHFYWKLFETAQELRQMSEAGRGQALTDPKASSLTFYEKGAWALAILRDRVGDAAYRKGVEAYLNKYRFKNVTVQNFIREIERSAQTDLSGYTDKWLSSTSFPWEEAKAFLLKNSPSVRLFFTKAGSDRFLLPWLREAGPPAYKKALIGAFEDQIVREGQALEMLGDPNWEIRQRAIQLVDSLPEAHRPQAEALLADKSYVTQETALYKLWSAFPEHRTAYLERTKDIQGLPNKNVRLLWLTLAIFTQEYQPGRTQAYFNELTGYTSPLHSWEVRLTAFQYLGEMGLDDTGLLNLMAATVHHSWQFKKYARNLVDQLWSDPAYKKRMEGLFKELNQEELRYMKTKTYN